MHLCVLCTSIASVLECTKKAKFTEVGFYKINLISEKHVKERKPTLNKRSSEVVLAFVAVVTSRAALGSPAGFSIERRVDPWTTVCE